MKQEHKFSVLTSYWFLGALGLLLLNDFFLKAHFHNWLTGKLSDFSGLFFFALFFAAFFPKHVKAIFIATALFFIYWKSSFSNSFIEFINGLSTYRFGRVVDYSDLIALSVLPFGYYLYKRSENLKQLKLHPVFPIVVGAFAMFSTSQLENIIDLNESYYIQKSVEDLRIKLINIDTQLAGVQTEISYLSNVTNDTLSFNLFISDEELCQAIYLNPIVAGIDSSSSRIYFSQTEQSCTERCGILKTCETSNTKEEIMEVIESNFIDFL